MDTRKSRPAESGWHTAFAPATLANFGSGFDAFAVAIAAVLRGARRPGASGGTGARGRISKEGNEPLGDRVSVRATEASGVRIVSIAGDGGRLPKAAGRNCASVAAAAVLRQARAPFGLEIALDKGLPLSSGLGSSAASAAAGAFAAAAAVASQTGMSIDKTRLLSCALAGEHIADGSWHGDNVFASLMGGAVVVTSTRPPEIVRLSSDRSLKWVTVHPSFELSTRRARAVLPKKVSIGDAVAQAALFATLVAAWERGDRRGIGRGLEDRLAAPRRARLLPGYEAVRRAALRTGAYGITFSGAGPSVLALTPEGEEESIGEAIRGAFRGAGLDSTLLVCAIDDLGARVLRE